MRRFWPLARGFIVTDTFGWQAWRNGTHWGVDFGRDGGSGGLPVYAVQGGTVVMVGAASGFGQWVVLDHPTADGSGTTVYGHVIPEVALGQRVEAGQRIARINPDSSTNGGVAPHLHLEWHRYVWVQPGSNRLDPLPLLEGATYPGEAPAVAAPAAGMTAQALSDAMGGTLSLDRYAELLPAFTNAMRAAECTTVERAAMWCAQIGHESSGLRWMEEIADGTAYNGRADLGNTEPGDGPRYKGSGPIQLTGRANFRAFSAWCHAKGWVDSPTYFEDSPALVRNDPHWGFLAATWYWTVARPGINAMCDARNLDGVTRAINGGLNGIADRSTRYQRCLDMGTALLPGEEDTVSDDYTREAAGQLHPFPGLIRQITRPENVNESTRDATAPWPAAIWADLWNEAVWDGYTIDPACADVPDAVGRSLVALIRTIAARQVRIESKLDQILGGAK